MEVEEKFVLLAGLICEPSRAKMLWNLLDGRAYTAGELALVADISATSASNHLSKLLDADLVKVESQGRHRYFSFARPEVAYTVESLANLAGNYPDAKDSKEAVQSGVKFCRTCYDHLAGYAGVMLTASLERKQYIEKSKADYVITRQGWAWAGEMGILEEELKNSRRPLAWQCLDWSERKPHIAGLFGAKLLSVMLQDKWFRRVQFSRALVLTSKGKQKLHELLDLVL